MFEIITVTEYCANNLVSTRKAIYYGKGKIEYLPEPEFDEMGEDEEQ